MLEVQVNYPKGLHELHSNMPFLPKGMKTDKCQNLVCNLYGKENCVIHTRTLNQALDQGLILQKVYRVIKFRKEVWLKPYIDMNTEFKTKENNIFEKDFFKLMKNSVFVKTTENLRKHRDIRLVSNDRK